MKSAVAAATLVLGMSLGLAHHASGQEYGVRATVPFDFAVGNHILPEGTYTIGPDGNHLLFRSGEPHGSLFTTALPGDLSKDRRSVLVFDNVNGKYFLRKIVSDSAKTSVEFPKSKLETNSQELATSRNIYAETSSR